MKKKLKHDVELPSDYQGKRAEWIAKKTQEFIAFKQALHMLEFGSAYLPEGCGNAMYMIARYVTWMAEAIKEWR